MSKDAHKNVDHDAPRTILPILTGQRDRQATVGRLRVSVCAANLEGDDAATAGATGRITVVRMQALGFEPVTELLPVVLLDGMPQPLLGDRARTWVLAAIADADPDVRSPMEALEDAA